MKRAESFIAQRKRRMGTVLAALLAGIAVLLAAAPARAAENGNQAVSLTVTPGSSAQLDALKDANLVVDIYQVASVDNLIPYKFTTKDAFAALKPQIEGEDVTNEIWRKVAADAFNLVKNAELKPILESRPVNEKIDLPGWGLYLVIARGSDISNYVVTLEDGSLATIARNGKEQFTFLPELVSVPGKDPDEYGKINTANGDTWLYDVNITLKPDQSTQNSLIEIVKTLGTYETKDPATFVFQVEAWYPAEKTDANKVYSNVVTLTYDSSSPVQKVYQIEDLPVGALVEITEVYSGANYRVTTDQTKTITVAAEEVMQAVFDNTYDDTYHGGGSIVNVFKYDENEGWVNEKIFDED